MHWKKVINENHNDDNDNNDDNVNDNDKKKKKKRRRSAGTRDLCHWFASCNDSHVCDIILVAVLNGMLENYVGWPFL